MSLLEERGAAGNAHDTKQNGMFVRFKMWRDGQPRLYRRESSNVVIMSAVRQGRHSLPGCGVTTRVWRHDTGPGPLVQAQSRGCDITLHASLLSGQRRALC